MLKRVASIALVIALSLAAAELSFRVIHRLGYDTPLPHGMRSGGSRRIGFTPSYEGTSRRGVRYRTNSLGFRDDAIDPNVQHVVFLGDSTTFGLNIAHSDTYPELLEQRLLADGTVCQSVNTASPGQATLDQLDRLRELFDSGQLNIRVVILGFFYNDFSDNMSYSGLLRRHDPRVLRATTWIRGTRTWIFVSGCWRRHRNHSTRRRVSEGLLPPPLDARREYGAKRGFEVACDWLSADELLQNTSYNLTVKALDEIADLANGRGVQFVFVHLPAGSDEILGEFDPKYKELLLDHLRRRGDVVCIDAAETYRAYLKRHDLRDLPSGFYSRKGDVSHPGPLACSLVAEELRLVVGPGLSLRQGVRGKSI